MHRTGWEPDTHPGTVFEYEWNDADPEAVRAHRPVRVTIGGLVLEDPDQVAAMFESVLALNRLKNAAIVTAIASLPPGVAMRPEEVRFAVNPEMGAVQLIVRGLSAEQAESVRGKVRAAHGDDVDLVIG